MVQKRMIAMLVAALTAAGASILLVQVASAHSHHAGRHHCGRHAGDQAAATPIKHLVVIFQENVSFDHYFGTYPHAANTSGEPFHGPKKADINGLYNTPGAGGTGTLLRITPIRTLPGTRSTRAGSTRRTSTMS